MFRINVLFFLQICSVHMAERVTMMDVLVPEDLNVETKMVIAHGMALAVVGITDRGNVSSEKRLIR